MSLKVDIVKNLFNDKRGSKKKNVSPNFSLQCRFDAGNEIIVLFGRSGSGKTTALQCISGLDKPDSGNISLNGRTFFDDTSKFNLQTQKRRVGYVFQNITLFPHMDVKQNIAFALKGLTQNEKEARIHEVMELIQIQELELYYPSQLSGGQKQRVVLARALAGKPDILLLDEPFSALDAIVRMHLREEIKDIQRTLNIPVLFITHNPVEAFTMADKVAVFHNGVVQQFATPEDVFYHPATRYVAELVGFSNLFDGAIVEEYDVCSKSIHLKFEELTLIVPHVNRRIAKNVSWGIRPENIRISKAGNSDEEKQNVFSGVIKSMENKGVSRLVSLKLNGCSQLLVAEITNHVLSALELGVGDDCRVWFEMSDIVIF